MYPQHLLSRLTIVGCGSPDIVGSLDSVQIMMRELEAGFKDMLSTLKAPTKFILDTMVAMSSHPLIKDAFPEAKSYLWWSPSAACLYSFVGKLPSLSSPAPANVKLRLLMVVPTTRRLLTAILRTEGRTSATP